MSILFKLEGKLVKPNVETLRVYPFNEIWERDTTEDKFEALEDFTYMEFVTSQKKSNPYSGYAEHLRKEKVQTDIITRESWFEDELIIEGMRKIMEFQREASPTYNYYMAAKIAAEKMQQFFRTFNMMTLNVKTGNPLYKPKDVTSALNDTSRVLENLNSLQEKVDNELFEVVKNKGQKQVSPLANPNTL